MIALGNIWLETLFNPNRNKEKVWLLRPLMKYDRQNAAFTSYEMVV